MVLRCRAWGRCLRACCLIGIFSCQVGSICEGTHSTHHLPAQSGQTGGVAAYGPNGGTRGGERYTSQVYKSGIQVGRYLDLEVGLNAQRQPGTAPKGDVAGAVHGRGVSRRVGATPKAKTCTCTPAYARPPAAPGRTPNGIC